MNCLIVLLFFYFFGIIFLIEHCEVQYSYQDYCDSCEDGYGLDFKGGCRECNISNNEISFMGICYKEIPNCSFYNKYFDREICRYCEDGFDFNKEQTKCIKCPNGKTSINGSKCIDINCKKTNNDRLCDNCNQGYVLAQNQLDCTKCDNESHIAPFGNCIEKIENCELYKDDNNCKKCKDNYYIDEEGKCKNCPEDKKSKGIICYKEVNDCSKYDSFGKCSECYIFLTVNKSYELNLIENKCIECQKNQISNGTKCFNRIDNCSSYIYEDGKMKCDRCSNGYELSEDKLKCNYCNNYYYQGSCLDVEPKKIVMCTSYFPDGKCRKCYDAYRNTGNACIACMRTFSSSGLNNSCYQVRSFCSEHNPKGECIKCKEGFKLNNLKNCDVKDENEDEDEGNNYNNNNLNKTDDDVEENNSNIIDFENNNYIKFRKYFYFILFLI